MSTGRQSGPFQFSACRSLSRELSRGVAPHEAKSFGNSPRPRKGTPKAARPFADVMEKSRILEHLCFKGERAAAGGMASASGTARSLATSREMSTHFAEEAALGSWKRECLIRGGHAQQEKFRQEKERFHVFEESICKSTCAV